MRRSSAKELSSFVWLPLQSGPERVGVDVDPDNLQPTLPPYQRQQRPDLLYHLPALTPRFRAERVAGAVMSVDLQPNLPPTKSSALALSTHSWHRFSDPKPNASATLFLLYHLPASTRRSCPERVSGAAVSVDLQPNIGPPPNLLYHFPASTRRSCPERVVGVVMSVDLHPPPNLRYHLPASTRRSCPERVVGVVMSVDLHPPPNAGTPSIVVLHRCSALAPNASATPSSSVGLHPNGFPTKITLRLRTRRRRCCERRPPAKYWSPTKDPVYHVPASRSDPAPNALSAPSLGTPSTTASHRGINLVSNASAPPV
ncbi:hypothetical protein B0H13DRAFT_1908238 [Mycena leptocephala]|nr:hypothetical protein B0H13DRAFT_1908238 [Mycena leptocephala]